MDARDAPRIRRPDQRPVRHGVPFQAEQIRLEELAVIAGQRGRAQRQDGRGGSRRERGVRRPGDRQRRPRQEVGRHPGRVRVEGQQRRATEQTEDSGVQVHAQSEEDVHVRKYTTRRLPLNCIYI